MRKRVIIESPFRGKDLQERKENMAYLVRCIRDSVARGEAPFASHGFYPGPLNEDIPEHREAGIECGYAWWDVARTIVFYADRGWSPGMEAAFKRAEDGGFGVRIRYLDPEIT